MSNVLRSSVLYVATGLVTVGVSLLVVTRVHSQVQTTSFEPFTAVLVTSHEDNTGARNDTETSLTAVRSDGSRAEMSVAVGNESEGTKTLLDVTNKRRVTIDPKTASQTTYPMSAAAVEDALRGHLCPGQLKGEHSTMLGYDVVKVTDLMPNTPAAQQRVDLWIAPALNCFPLREEAFLLKEGEVKARNISTVISISKGDPDPTLFQVPPGLTERSPSAVMAARAKLHGDTQCTSCSTRTANLLDQVYQRAQSLQ